MKRLLTALFLLLSMNAFAEMVTIQGKIDKVVPSKKEIYVKDKEGKRHEFYFTDHTLVKRGEKDAKFEDLKVDQSVQVKADKKGKRLDPHEVTITD